MSSVGARIEWILSGPSRSGTLSALENGRICYLSGGCVGVLSTPFDEPTVACILTPPKDTRLMSLASDGSSIYAVGEDGSLFVGSGSENGIIHVNNIEFNYERDKLFNVAAIGVLKYESSNIICLAPCTRGECHLMSSDSVAVFQVPAVQYLFPMKNGLFLAHCIGSAPVIISQSGVRSVGFRAADSCVPLDDGSVVVAIGTQLTRHLGTQQWVTALPRREHLEPLGSGQDVIRTMAALGEYFCLATEYAEIMLYKARPEGAPEFVQGVTFSTPHQSICVDTITLGRNKAGQLAALGVLSDGALVLATFAADGEPSVVLTSIGHSADVTGVVCAMFCNECSIVTASLDQTVQQYALPGDIESAPRCAGRALYHGSACQSLHLLGTDMTNGVDVLVMGGDEEQVTVIRPSKAAVSAVLNQLDCSDPSETLRLMTSLPELCLSLALDERTVPVSRPEEMASYHVGDRCAASDNGETTIRPFAVRDRPVTKWMGQCDPLEGFSAAPTTWEVLSQPGPFPAYMDICSSVELPLGSTVVALMAGPCARTCESGAQLWAIPLCPVKERVPLRLCHIGRGTAPFRTVAVALSVTGGQLTAVSVSASGWVTMARVPTEPLDQPLETVHEASICIQQNNSRPLVLAAAAKVISAATAVVAAAFTDHIGLYLCSFPQDDVVVTELSPILTPSPATFLSFVQPALGLSLPLAYSCGMEESSICLVNVEPTIVLRSTIPVITLPMSMGAVSDISNLEPRRLLVTCGRTVLSIGLRRNYSAENETKTTQLEAEVELECAPYIHAPAPPVMRVGIDSHHNLLHTIIRGPINSNLQSLHAQRALALHWTSHALVTMKMLRSPYTISSLIQAVRDLYCDGFFSGELETKSIQIVNSFGAILALADLQGCSEDIGSKEIFTMEMWRQWHRASGTTIRDFTVEVGSGIAIRAEIDGEYDTRTTYSGVIVALAAGELTEDLALGILRYIASCVSFDGGFSGLPGCESHSGYTFSALATCELIRRYVAPTSESVTNLLRQFDYERCLDWCLRRQTDQGGYCGRPGKVVDSCYSWWNGAAYELARTLTVWQFGERPLPTPDYHAVAWYVSSCAQVLEGGFRDKPSVIPDIYHTCYSLSGLSLCAMNGVQIDKILMPVDPATNLSPSGLRVYDRVVRSHI